MTLPSIREVQATPVVVAGVMYVTYANECFALDAGSGRQIWHYQRSRTQGLGRELRFRCEPRCGGRRRQGIHGHR